MRTAFLIALLTPTLAPAHPGHLAEAAGHSHWVAGALVGAAVVIGALAWGRRDKAGAEEGEEAPAGEEAT